jgi:hypothetical protein
MATQHCPAQQRTFDQRTQVLPVFPILGVAGRSEYLALEVAALLASPGPARQHTATGGAAGR